MKQFSKQFYTRAKTVKLQAAEQQELRERVVSYMEYHPLPAGQKNQASPLSTGGFRTVSIPFSIFSKWTVAASVFVLMVLPLLAEQAVPGDSLYAIKVRFNEEVRGSLALSPYEKVEWETERLNRRIAEVRLLASEGRLTEEVEVAMADAVREHTENVQREIEVLREDDADQAILASIELNSTLEVQSSSLQEGDGTMSSAALASLNDDSSTQFLVDVINESLARQESNITTSSIPAYEVVMARVELNTTRAYELLGSLELDQTDLAFTDISRRLEDVNRSIQKANELRTQDEPAAQAALVDSLQRIQKIIIFMTELQVSDAVDIENIVPVVPTVDEERVQLQNITTEITQKSEIILAVLPQVSVEATEKIVYSLDLVAGLQAEMASSSAFGQTKKLGVEALSLLNDALTLIESEGVSTTVLPVVEEAPIVSEEVPTTTEPTIEEAI